MATRLRMASLYREVAGAAVLLNDRQRLLHALSESREAFDRKALKIWPVTPSQLGTLAEALQTLKGTYEWLNAIQMDLDPRENHDFTIKKWDAKRAKQQKYFQFFAAEGFRADFPAAFRYDGALEVGANGELFDEFAAWMLHQHPEFTSARDVDDYCRQGPRLGKKLMRRGALLAPVALVWLFVGVVAYWVFVVMSAIRAETIIKEDCAGWAARGMCKHRRIFMLCYDECRDQES